MKNTRMIFTALAVALTLGTFQVEAKKSAARERFDESYNRMKKCFSGKCTRMEVIKAARDLGAAALVVAGALYLKSKVSRAGLETGAQTVARAGRDVAQAVRITGTELGKRTDVGRKATGWRAPGTRGKYAGAGRDPRSSEKLADLP